MPPTETAELKVLDFDGLSALETLSMGQRIIELKAVPYGVIADSRYGKIMFERGAFGEVNPAEVRLRMDHEDPPTGLGDKFTDKGDGAYVRFKVSKTSRGDDQLQLAKDGVSRGASVGFEDVVGDTGPTLQQLNGEFVTVYGPNSAVMREVSTTWMPTFSDAGVTHMMSTNGQEENPTVPPEGTTGEGVKDTSAPQPQINLMTPPVDTKHFDDKVDKMLGAFEEWQEQVRKSISVPGPTPEAAPKPKLYDWAMVALQLMRGQPQNAETLKKLALPDVITSDNPGLVPEVLVNDLTDLIRLNRPFINSLRQIAPPSTGMSLIVPAILQRAVTGTQSAQKADITGATAPQVGTLTFPYEQVFGGADIAIQMLNRGDASFFDLLMQLLAEAYSLDAEGKALDALLNPTGTISGGGTIDPPNDGGTLDPENALFGEAWENSITVYRRAPDSIWMDAAAVAQFIDAKSPMTNAPLYSNLAAAFTAANGPGGVLSGLAPYYVPAMDDLPDVDVIVGPSRSYVYAEDPARNLQVDVPSKAGRDVALVGGFFFGPRYASAFTTYRIGS